MIWNGGGNVDKSRILAAFEYTISRVVFIHRDSFSILSSELPMCCPVCCRKPTFSTFRQLITICLFACAFQSPLAPLAGQEPTAEPTATSMSPWRLLESDCNLPKAEWRQTTASSSGNAQIRFQCGTGTKVIVAKDVAPAFVISELQPRLNIKSPRPGICLLARVVLPNSKSKRGLPVTTYLEGPCYSNANSWQTLGFSPGQLSELLSKKIWILRHENGPNVDIQNAYVDQLILNAYTGPGENQLEIGGLEIIGSVTAESVSLAKRLKRGLKQSNHARIDSAEANEKSKIKRVSFESDEPKHPAIVRRNGSVLEIEGKPFFPRLIQHNGESFEFLKSLGFNTIQLRGPATHGQLQSAKQLDMWIVCPAPPSASRQTIPLTYDRVLAWSVGEKLSVRDLTNLQQSIHGIRQSDSREARPVVADIASHWKSLAPVVDIVATGVSPFGSSFIASGYSDWIQDRSAVVSHAKPIWANIQTQFPKRTEDQISSFFPMLPPISLQPQQIKYGIYEAISGGARGLRFLSHDRLDSTDPLTKLRATTLQWAMKQVAQIEPWALGGALMGEIETSEPNVEVNAIKTNRSRLLLVQRSTNHEQYWAGDVPLRSINFLDNNGTSSDRVYQITEAGVLPISTNRKPTNTRIWIEDCPYATAVVLTQDALVLNRLNSVTNPAAGSGIGKNNSALELHSELTRQWLAIMQLIDGQLSRMNRKVPAASGALNTAVNEIRLAADMQAKNSPRIAIKHLNQADERIAFAVRELMTEPLGQFKSKTSSPLLLHASLVPLHWQLSDRLNQATWNPNSLTGGDFENLQHMLRYGWENQRSDDDTITTSVNLSKNAVVAGEFGLRMQAAPADGQPMSQILQTAPIWITSAKSPVKAGQMVRIHGWVNVPKTIVGSHDGLLITDSLGGIELAERVPVTTGWQEFTLYRGASTNGDISVTFSLTGYGEAMIDEVTIRTIDLKQAPVRAAQKPK